MLNWYGIETEAEFRRQEWQRMVEAEERAALAHSGRIKGRGLRLPGFRLQWLRPLAVWRRPFTAPASLRRQAAYSAK